MNRFALLGLILFALIFGLSGCQSKPSAEGASVFASSTDSSPQIVMASGVLQKCLGISPGSGKMTRSAATQPYCKQLPGASSYDQAGGRFQAGDHAGAAQIVSKAAEMGNAVAQLRLALMYDQGDGVQRSAKSAFGWYSRAAAQGEPESQEQVGLFYELAEGVPENWDLAAKLYEASASQGWTKGQFALARAYQFGIGVPQNRQTAIAWYKKSAAQGNAKERLKQATKSSDFSEFEHSNDRPALSAARFRKAVSCQTQAGQKNVSFVHMVRPTICQKSQYQNRKVQCEKFQIEVYDPRLNYYKRGVAADSITSHSSDEQNPRDSTHKQ